MSSSLTDPAEISAVIAVYDSLEFSVQYLMEFISMSNELIMYMLEVLNPTSNRHRPPTYLPRTDETSDSCNLLVKVGNGLVFTQYLTWATFSGMRALALSRNWYTAVPIFGLSVVAFGVNMAHFGLGMFGTNDPILGCVPEIPITAEEAKKLTILVRTCLMTSDVCLTIITWVGIPRYGGNVEAIRASSLSNILMRNGLIYFAVLFVLNSLHLAFTLISFVRAYSPTSYLTIFTEPITAVLVSRFLLDLQAASRKTVRMDPEDPLYISTVSLADTLTFARVIGSLGESIVAGEAGRSSDDYIISEADDEEPNHEDE
ncbi:hypothetical protein K466DRAFT_565440 [Polyporus arcularius HHB13444]|uniref:Uncharacterized protein n=1 Tax=Polyporus arcularius HHB13444 TaxID=1314778 RepID=A0A5C3PGK4_9APHY|nr:hypothetical protein K466DRAFT_565440 [Polyporus arcularius HHB13444]